MTVSKQNSYSLRRVLPHVRWMLVAHRQTYHPPQLYLDFLDPRLDLHRLCHGDWSIRYHLFQTRTPLR